MSESWYSVPGAEVSQAAVARLRYVVDDASPYGNPEKHLDLATAPSYQLFFSCFVGDVELVIGDADFSADFGWIATLSFGIGMLHSLRRLPVGGVSHAGFLESEDRIDFQLEGSLVRVSCTYADSVATIEHGDLTRLATDALVELLRGLEAKYPGLRENRELHKQLSDLGLG
jgi:hypothetical protein